MGGAALPQIGKCRIELEGVCMGEKAGLVMPAG